MKKINYKVIIIEGVTTSGKSTVIDNLNRYFIEHGVKSKLLREEETVIPLIDNTDLNVSLSFLNNLLTKVLNSEAQITLLDRFHFSHTLKTGSNLEDFKMIEENLNINNSILVFLWVPEEILRKRIADSLKYRSKKWVKYVMSRSNNDINRVFEYYIERQNYLFSLYKKTTLSKIIIYTGSQDYISITREIIDKLKITPDDIELSS